MPAQQRPIRFRLPSLERATRLRVDELPVAAAAVSIVVGSVALAGWALGSDELRSFVPGQLTMKVNTAIAFLLLGAGLLLRNRPPGSRPYRLGAIPLVAIMVLSGVIVSQDLTGHSLGIDQWLFRELPGQIGTVEPNRMSPMTVACFVLLSAAVLLAGHRRGRRLAPALLLGAISLAMLNVLDQLFDAAVPSLLAGWTQMAPVTAIAVIAIGVGSMGLLPGGGPLEAFRGDLASARLARRLVAASLVVPIALAWLRVQGEERGFYDSQYGSSLLVLGSFLFLAAVIWQAARTARRTEIERTAALEELDRFFGVSIDLLATASADGRFVKLNPAWTTVLGYSVEELCSRPFVDFVHPDDIEATNREVDRQVREGRSVLNFQNRYRHLDGSYRWLEWTSVPSADGSRLYAVARDVTERRLEEDLLRAPARADARRRHEAQERILATIELGAFGPVFQPIIELGGLTVVGYEALTRFADGSRPDEMFATAIQCDLGAALERVTLAAALAGARDLPRGSWLSVNVSPSLLIDVPLMQSVLGVRARPLVIEITEHETIPAYGPLRDAIAALGPDVRLAVDDAGAGVANFNHLVELRPDFVKIDAGLVRGVDSDVSRQAVVAGILHFATTAGCDVIAEGIETDAELEKLRELGVTLGQGYLLGRPAPALDWHDVATGPATRRTDRRPRVVRRAG